MLEKQENLHLQCHCQLFHGKNYLCLRTTEKRGNFKWYSIQEFKQTFQNHVFQGT